MGGIKLYLYFRIYGDGINFIIIKDIKDKDQITIKKFIFICNLEKKKWKKPEDP